MIEMQTKQVIIIRNDLNMRKGKMMAQAAHASNAFLINKAEFNKVFGYDVLSIVLKNSEEVKDWVQNSNFTKVCLQVNSEKELTDIYNKALKAGLIAEIITDAGKTEFHNVPTITCCCIGPNISEEIDKITGHLKLI